MKLSAMYELFGHLQWKQLKLGVLAPTCLCKTNKKTVVSDLELETVYISLTVWIVVNTWWKPVSTHSISVVLALVGSVNSLNLLCSSLLLIISAVFIY